MGKNKAFKPIKRDFRIDHKGYFSYKDILMRNFDYFEKYLYHYGFIDENYNFINKPGNKIELTSILIFMIGCNKIFARKNYKIQREFYLHEYRQYFDIRYNITPSIKQLFNRVMRNRYKGYHESFYEFCSNYNEGFTYDIILQYPKIHKILKKYFVKQVM